MNPPPKSTSFGEGRRAAVSFLCAACVLGMAALFWIGDEGLFHYLALLPGLIGLLLVYSGVHALVASKTPATTITLSEEPLRLGRKTTVLIRQGGPIRLASLRANLVCERIEKDVERSRVITFPCQLNFFDRGSCVIGDLESKSFRTEVTVPADGEPSCQGVSLDVLWRIEIWGKVIGGADFMRPFVLEVEAT